MQNFLKFSKRTSLLGRNKTEGFSVSTTSFSFSSSSQQQVGNFSLPNSRGLRSSFRSATSSSFTSNVVLLRTSSLNNKRFFSTEIDELLDFVPKQKSKPKEVKTKGVQQKGQTRRWYKQVSIEPYTSAAVSGFQLLLDNRIVKTPSDNRLIIPTQQLAYATAVEWDEQDNILPNNMPLTALACTAIDEMPKKRTMCVDRLTSYLKTDTLTVRDPNPKLRKLQEQYHDPLVQWLSRHFNVPELITSTNILHPEMPETTMTTIQWILFGENDWVLTGLDTLCHNLRSFVLAAALWKNHITIAEAINASRLEENYQSNINGIVEGSHDVEESQLEFDVGNAAFFLHNLSNK